MSSGADKSIESILDGVRPNQYLIGVWIWCALVAFFDGYDLTAIAVIAPEMVKEFGIDRSSLGIVFGASVIGMAIGGPLAGLIGDRYGRKFTIVLSCFLVGGGTLAILVATTATQLAACRLVVGLGLGAAIPSIIALSAEFTPKRSRKRIMALIQTAVPVGAIIPGLLAATVVSSVGWRILPIVGGVFPVLIGVILIWRMPESIKYLALRPDRQTSLAGILKRIDPMLESVPNYMGTASGRARSASPARLFEGGLMATTLLFWVVFFANAMVNYLVISWMPLVLQSSGLSREGAGLAAAMWAVGGLVGGLGVVALLSRGGVALLAVMFLVSVPFLAFMAWDLSPSLLIACVLIAGITVGAIQIGANTLVGLLYQTGVRVTGVGWALGVGRIGAILGPVVGAAVFALQLPPREMFGLSAVPMAVGALAAIFLAILCYRRFGGLQFDEAVQAPPRLVTAEPKRTEA